MKMWGDEVGIRGNIGMSKLGLAFENWKASKGIGVGPETKKRKEKKSGKETK